MKRLSLNNKILLLLLLSIAAALAMVGSLFAWLITDLAEDTARIELLNSAEIIRSDLKGRRERLLESAQRHRHDSEVLATVYLIWRYQDPADYQAQVFDTEKHKLVTTLEQIARNQELSLAAIYDANGQLLAYYAIHGDAASGGYASYQDGDAVLVQGGRVVEIPEVAETLGLYGDLHWHALSEDGGFHLHRSPRQTVVMEAVMPFQSDDGKVLGWIRLAYDLDADYLQGMADKLRTDLAWVSDDGVISSNDFKPLHHLPSSFSAPDFVLDGGMDFDAGWYVGSDGFGAHFAMPLEGEEPTHLLLSRSKSELRAGLTTFGQAVFWVLLASGLVVLPVGLLYTRRWISVPVQRLTTVAQHITQGERPTLQGEDSDDELGTLAAAFKVMSAAISEREDELRAKQREIEGIIGNAPAVIYMRDREGRYLLVNNLYEQLFSIKQEEVIGKSDAEIFPVEVADLVRRNDQRVIETRAPLQVEEYAPHRDGLHTYFSIKFPLFDDTGEVIAVCGISTDITERKRTESDLLLAKKVIESAREAVVITDLEGMITDINSAFEKITGFSRDEVIGKTPAINKSGHHDDEFYQEMWESLLQTGQWEGEIWDRRKDGEVYPKWLSINTVRNDEGQATHYVGIFSDISEQKDTEEQLEQLAYYDPLTRLPNRFLFRERLGQAIVSARRRDGVFALLFVDLDRFKFVNDTLGHAAGDELLKRVAVILQAQVRESDTVARLGGDEFTIILSTIRDSNGVSALASKLLKQLATPLVIHGHEVHIGGSIGVAMYPEDGDSIEELTQHADMALYKAKDEGRNNFQFFSQALQEQVNDRQRLDKLLRGSLERGEYVLHYQPKYALAEQEVSGMEALVRWHVENVGTVPPDKFIPIAEENGLIVPLGRWILEQACEQAVRWNRGRERPLRVAVNLSARQFKQQDLVAVVAEVLTQSGLQPEYLELELTESMVMEDVEQAILTMQALRQLGIKLSIDDFGTGYSSLNYLKRFPIDALKIDRSFVSDLPDSADDVAIVQAITAMAKSLDLAVVAEGVETQEQMDFMARLRCEEVQGYFLSRPLSAEDFSDFLAKSLS